MPSCLFMRISVRKHYPTVARIVLVFGCASPLASICRQSRYSSALNSSMASRFCGISEFFCTAGNGQLVNTREEQVLVAQPFLAVFLGS